MKVDEMKLTLYRVVTDCKSVHSDEYQSLICYFSSVEKLRQKYRWIPVEESLPVDSSKVLLMSSHGAVFRGYYDHKWKCWRTTKSVKVTHWRHPDRLDDWNELGYSAQKEDNDA